MTTNVSPLRLISGTNTFSKDQIIRYAEAKSEIKQGGVIAELKITYASLAFLELEGIGNGLDQHCTFFYDSLRSKNPRWVVRKSGEDRGSLKFTAAYHVSREKGGVNIYASIPSIKGAPGYSERADAKLLQALVSIAGSCNSVYKIRIADELAREKDASLLYSWDKLGLPQLKPLDAVYAEFRAMNPLATTSTHGNLQLLSHSRFYRVLGKPEDFVTCEVIPEIRDVWKKLIENH